MIALQLILGVFFLIAVGRVANATNDAEQLWAAWAMLVLGLATGFSLVA